MSYEVRKAYRYERGKAARYDMIALLDQTVPKAHYNLAKPIITLNSPKAIITSRPSAR